MFALPASTALSGMNAAQAGLRTSGHNIANLGTEGFRRQQVVAAEGSNGGVTTTVTRAEDVGASLETDVVGLLQSKNAFLANLAVFRASDRMSGSLLDISA
ncbi:MAG: flagellar basal body protein [Rhizobacter sp.]